MATGSGAYTDDFSHSIDSAVRGFHVYKNIWTLAMNEVLQTRQEIGNPEDEHAVAVVKTSDAGERTVGHVPKELSRICWGFLHNDGEIICTVTGSRRRSPLMQGGLEVPCRYKFIGKRKHIKKLRSC